MPRFVFLILALLIAAPATAAAPFRFGAFKTYNAMRDYIGQAFKPGDARDSLRRVFVEEGKATQIARPGQPLTEKYLYDVNLCDRYLWRWNISADYDAEGKLVQAWVNGLPVFMSGPAKKDPVLKDGSKMVPAERMRPQAKNPSSKLLFMLTDIDGNLETLDDQYASGHGPSRADPFFLDLGVSYDKVEIWRSIFDADDADTVAPYGDCEKMVLPGEIQDILKLPGQP
ncbi:MAG TPA: hypothetical protein VEF76_14150 [Patescibacteria group bacterium]|nr:hypothetical protein [Patescibacteria group bacterium]